MFILAVENLWNYTFIAVAIIAIGIGAFLEIRRIKKDEYKERRNKRTNKK